MKSKNYPIAGMQRMLLTLCLSILGFNATASHIVGTDLYYKHINLDTYKVTVVLYGDCGPASAGAFAGLPTSAPRVCVYDGSVSIGSVALSPDTGSNVEITPLCPGDTSQCTNPSSTIPGVKKFRYSALYVLPHTSATWRFVYQGYNGASGSAGRAAAITNISMAGASMIELESKLDNTIFNNSSANLTVSQQTFFCNLQHDEYNPGIIDPDGDSVVVSLIAVKNGSASTGCASSGGAPTYTGSAWAGTPISATKPLQVLVDSFAIDSSSGKLIFHPNALQRAVILYNMSEYRSGVLVGTSQREMTVLVLDCTTTFPCMLTSSLKTPMDKIGKFDIYPNPANDLLTIKNIGHFSSVEITNTLGQIQIKQSNISSGMILNISNLNSGIYYVTLRGESGISVSKFVKI